jgi:pyruvate/2-oxoacid:ferredoxin oxidoreductase alpha subunit
MEDEIASICAITGASLVGKSLRQRDGISQMQEHWLCQITETPCVV